MSANKIVTNHLIETPIGVTIDQESDLGEPRQQTPSAEKAADIGNNITSEEQPLSLMSEGEWNCA